MTEKEAGYGTVMRKFFVFDPSQGELNGASKNPSYKTILLQWENWRPHLT